MHRTRNYRTFNSELLGGAGTTSLLVGYPGLRIAVVGYSVMLNSLFAWYENATVPNIHLGPTFTGALGAILTHSLQGEAPVPLFRTDRGVGLSFQKTSLLPLYMSTTFYWEAD